MNYPMSFIKATEHFSTFEKPIPAPYIRKSFLCDSPCSAKLVIAACGFYEVYINGQRYTKGFLAPYISNPDHIIYCDAYDIPLDAGENVIGLLLGNGFQNNQGGYVWDFDKSPFRSAPTVALSLTYQNAAGEEISLESDETFLTSPSPIRRDDYRFGEIYDASYEQPGWNDKGFDDSHWIPVIPVSSYQGLLNEVGLSYSGITPRGELRLCTADPILTEKELHPVRIIPEGDGYIYDFGECNAGVCRLTINGTAGQKIVLQHADMLKDDGTLALENVWFVREFWETDRHIIHKDIYICKGKGTETYMPTFTYHGFRYVKVEGITKDQATPELLTYVVFHSDIKSRGGFRCSDETVNKLQEITRRSDTSNFHYFPTDCPQREKNGWTGDAALSAEHMLLNFCVEKSFREWQRNICKAQDHRGALPGIVPTGGWGYAWGSGPAWDRVLVTLPYFVYKYRGETDMIHESATAFMSYLHYLTTQTDQNGLIHIGLGDWCHVNRENPKAPLELTDTIMSMDIAYKMSFLFHEIGMTIQSHFAQQIGDNFKTAIRNHLIDFGTMIAAGNCQTSQALCLYYDVFTPAESQTAFLHLLEMIHEADDHIDIGVLGGRVIFHVLSRFGYSDLALKMIIRPDFPSYGYMLQQGATTLWETFSPGPMKDSINHHFWGDISAWFIKRLAGICYNPQANDIYQVNIQPHFVESLTFAEGYYDAPAGRIFSRWERKEDHILLTLEFPETMHATLYLENGYTLEHGLAYQNVQSGTYVILCK